VFILYYLEHLLYMGINDLSHGLWAFGNRVHYCGIIDGLDITYGTLLMPLLQHPLQLHNLNGLLALHPLHPLRY
jgi:hypothetical protein